MSAPAVPAPERSRVATASHLSAAQVEELGRELDTLRARTRAALGQSDADYIRAVIRAQRLAELGGRVLITLGARRRSRPVLSIGTVLLTLSKVLSNMEIGHNVMHGQYDWMGDPGIHSAEWEWDAVSTAASWKHAHNFQHHTYTNVLGLDRDLGYSAMRVDAEQPWHPIYVLQPIYGLLMALTFEWGIALYDMELDGVRRGAKSREQARAEVRAFARKAGRQVVKDFVAWPALAGRRGARKAAAADLAANVARNLWVHTIVFMGHIPEGAETFTQEQAADETRGEFYLRQLIGSANLDGTRLFHVLSGSLSFQIEHHLFPDLPSSRYPELAPQVREVCERYRLPYNSGRLGRQYRSVARKVLRNSLP